MKDAAQFQNTGLSNIQFCELGLSPAIVLQQPGGVNKAAGDCPVVLPFVLPLPAVYRHRNAVFCWLDATRGSLYALVAP